MNDDYRDYRDFRDWAIDQGAEFPVTASEFHQLAVACAARVLTDFEADGHELIDLICRIGIGPERRELI